ncbi:coiled-coil domain-containing protein 89 [Pseudophryne corroboree]|uniref:coiled-coil domain-containing protein 89 n=1 Tax=Pseudophryne corroboree TaxID=495146 RepID=UPI00308144D5
MEYVHILIPAEAMSAIATDNSGCYGDITFGVPHNPHQPEMALTMTDDTGGSKDDEAGVPSIQKLSSLPWDAETENRLLRSRLDEQSQLICMLKRRADDTLLQCQGLEEENRELQRRCTDAGSALAAERTRGDRLEDRFGTLAANHQDMIRFKDEYKRQNKALREECQSLRDGKYLELLERDRDIQELRAQLQTAVTELGPMQKRVDELLGREESRIQELHLLQRRLEDSETTCHQVKEDLCRLEEVRRTEQKDAEKKVDELSKEKQDLLHLCMERGRLLQEHQREAAELTNRLQSAQKAIRDAEERFQRDVTAVDADARIVQLNTRLGNSENELGQLRREFEAYKKHSGELLAKERDLNAKLRHLIG